MLLQIILEILVSCEHHLTHVLAHGSLRVCRHALLKEVVLRFQADAFHEVKGVGCVPALLVAELLEEAVGDVFNVLAHKRGVHANEADRERLGDELFFNGYCGFHYRECFRGGEFVIEFGVEEAGGVGVEAFITANELVGYAEARHEAALLEPEDGAEGAREEDALHGGEGKKAGCERGLAIVNPLKGPVRLVFHGREIVDRLESLLLLVLVVNESINKERVCF